VTTAPRLSRRTAALLVAAAGWTLQGLGRARADDPAALPASDAPPPPTPQTGELPDWARAQHPFARRALVVGNANYCKVDCLPTPLEDVRLIKEALAVRFDSVDPYLNVENRVQMTQVIEEFSAKIEPGDFAMVYFSGHGIERDNENYLVPTAARLVSPRWAYLEDLKVDTFLETLAKRSAGRVLVVLAPC